MSDPGGPEGASLRETVMHSAAYLALREFGGIGLRLAGILVLTRLIGPTNYGLFAGPAAIAAFVALIASAGTDFFLLRLEDEPADQAYHQAFWMIAAWSTIVTLAALAFVPLLRRILPDHRFIGPYIVLAAITPINVLWIPAQTKLERTFRYRAMATIELIGDFTLYAVALVLAFLGAGVWAPVAGYVAWQAWLLVGACGFAHYRPRWAWTKADAWQMFRDGSGFSTSALIDRIGDLANPLVVGHFLGATAVGIVALAGRICDVCTFVRRVLWRLSVVAFAKVQRDTDRLRSALEDAMGLQLLTVGSLLAGACFVAPWVIPAVFGRQWKPAVPFLPLLAMTSLIASSSLAQVSVLTVRNKIATVVRINLANFVVLFSLSYVLVPHLGIKGYGIGEIAATGAAAVVANVELRRILSFSYRSVAPWFLGAAPVMAAPWLAFPVRMVVLIPALLILGLPSTRRQFMRQATMALSALLRRTAATDATEPAEDDIGRAGFDITPPDVM